MSDVPTLTDGVVTLRAHRPSDAARVLEQCLDPLSQEMTTVPLDYTAAMATGFVTEMMPAGWVDDSEWGFAVEVDGDFAGTVSLRPEAPGRVEIAYGSHPSVRGTGTMERALRVLLDWGFAQRGVRTVVWRAFVGNWASRKAAWRLGFTLEGTLRGFLPQRGELRDAWVATLLREDPREPKHPWLVVPTIEADGLRLRPWRESDVPRMVEACSDPETQRWLGRLPAPYDEAAARWFLADAAERLATASGMTWAVVDPDDDLALASVGWFDWTPRVEVEVGYWVHPDARGRGVARRSASAVIAYAFQELQVRRVKAFAAADNAASRRVLEACGLRHTGIERLGAEVRAGTADLALYDVLASEWTGAAAPSERR